MNELIIFNVISFGLNIFVLLLYLLSTYLMMVGCFCTGSVVLEGTLWGIQIQASNKQKRLEKRRKSYAMIGIGMMVVLCIPCFRAMIYLLIACPLIVLIYLGVWFSLFFVAPKHFSRYVLRLQTKESYALVMSEHPFIRKTDENIANLDSFFVGSEIDGLKLDRIAGVAFEEYGLKPPSTKEEIGLLGLYYHQRYHEKFKTTLCTRIKEIPTNVWELHITSENTIIAGRKTRTEAKFEGYLFERK